MRIRKSLVPLLAVPLFFAVLGCSSVKAEKGPFRNDDGYDPDPGSNGTSSGSSTGTTGGTSTSTGSGGAGTGSGDGTGGATGSGTGGAGTGSGGSSTMDASSCQTFDYGNYQAPAAAVSLKSDIVPIFTKSCSLSSGCHSDKSAQPPRLGPSNGMVDATGLQTIRNELIAASAQVPTLKLVSPGKPEESYLMNKIDGTFNCMGFACRTQAGCGERMPQLLDALDADKISKIRGWIKQGAAAN